jgi:Domain of unknown function (DUF3859)
MRLGLLLAALLSGPALAEVRPLSPLIESLTAGVFCPEDFMDKVEAPETELGYILSPSSEPEITWLSTEVPARLGIAFGLQMAQTDGPPIGLVEVEVTRPLQNGETGTDRWEAFVGPEGTSTNFWVFSEPSELANGDWTFRIRQGDEMLVEVTFVVMDPVDIKGPVPDCVASLS